MKKITLISIILFVIVMGGLFIGGGLSAIGPDNAINTNSASQNNRDVNQQINNVNNGLDNGETINKNSNNTNSSSSSSTHHISSPDIDISKLSFDSSTSIKDTFTIDEVAKHNTKNDCYLIINNKVYDVSSYMDYHPAGSRIITLRCGKEVTGIFARIHSNRAWDLLKRYKIGTITTNKPDKTSQVLTAISDALKKANPNAKVVKVSPKMDFYVAKIIYEGKLYEVHINNLGKIFKEEIEDDEHDWSLWETDKDDK